MKLRNYLFGEIERVLNQRYFTSKVANLKFPFHWNFKNFCIKIIRLWLLLTKWSKNCFLSYAFKCLEKYNCTEKMKIRFQINYLIRQLIINCRFGIEVKIFRQILWSCKELILISSESIRFNISIRSVRSGTGASSVVRKFIKISSQSQSTSPRRGSLKV